MNFMTRLEGIAVPFIGLILLVINLLIPSTMGAYVSTALFAVVALIRPKESILFLLVYFPLRSFLIEINPGLKMVGDIVIVFVFIRVLWDSRNDIKSIFKFELFEWAFIAFLILGSVSALFSNVTPIAIITQVRAFAITFLLLYIVKRLDITKRDIVNFLVVTVFTALILVIQGLIEKLSLRSALMPENWINRQLSSNNSSRIYGLINNPNVLAVYLTIVGLLTYYLKTLVPKKSVQWFLNIFLVLLSGAWVLTFSRGTWIAFAIGLVVYTLFKRNWQFVIKTIVIIALGFILVSIPVTYSANWISNHTLVGDFERTGTPEDDNVLSIESTRLKETFNASTFEKSKTTGRLLIVYMGLEVFKDNPIIGTGFATFGDSASKVYSSPIYEEYEIGFNIYTDNQYIQVIAQTGVVGVILFAVFLLGMLVVFWKKRNAVPSAFPMLAVLIAVFWCGLIYNIWEDKTFTMYFYIITAAFLSFADKNERQIE